MGFTDHDADLEVDGSTYQASTGFDAAALQTSAGLSVDNSAAVGALSAAGITEVDIATGKFDGAVIIQMLVNWQDSSQNLVIFRGSLGEVVRGDGSFEAELRGLAENLNHAIGRSYLRQCDRRLGDAKCGVEISAPAFSSGGAIDRVDGTPDIYVSGAGDYDDDWFSHGRLEWVTGANAGLVSDISSDRLDGAFRVINLWQLPHYPETAGDEVRLIAGCDKRASTCKAKFGNFVNFRGFPHLPGEDWVTAYPVSANANTGGSIVPYE
jgi:uncharacterized phage protein (TIGR02218 family)